MKNCVFWVNVYINFKAILRFSIIVWTFHSWMLQIYLYCKIRWSQLCFSTETQRYFLYILNITPTLNICNIIHIKFMLKTVLIIRSIFFRVSFNIRVWKSECEYKWLFCKGNVSESDWKLVFMSHLIVNSISLDFLLPPLSSIQEFSSSTSDPQRSSPFL